MPPNPKPSQWRWVCLYTVPWLSLFLQLPQEKLSSLQPLFLGTFSFGTGWHASAPTYTCESLHLPQTRLSSRHYTPFAFCYSVHIPPLAHGLLLKSGFPTRTFFSAAAKVMQIGTCPLASPTADLAAPQPDYQQFTTRDENPILHINIRYHPSTLFFQQKVGKVNSRQMIYFYVNGITKIKKLNHISL